MFFMNWILVATVICFISYVSLSATKGGKRFWRKGKLLDQIEDKYDVLRASRREMMVRYTYNSLFSNTTIGLSPRVSVKKKRRWRRKYSRSKTRSTNSRMNLSPLKQGRRSHSRKFELIHKK